MRLLEWMPDAARYEPDAYRVYGALPVNNHVVGKRGAVNLNEGLFYAAQEIELISASDVCW